MPCSCVVNGEDIDFTLKDSWSILGRGHAVATEWTMAMAFPLLKTINCPSRVLYKRLWDKHVSVRLWKNQSSDFLQVEVWILPISTAKKMIHSQLERRSSFSAPLGTPMDSRLGRLYSAQEVLLEFSFVVLLLACFLFVIFASRLLRHDAYCNGFAAVWRFLNSYAAGRGGQFAVWFNLNGVYTKCKSTTRGFLETFNNPVKCDTDMLNGPAWRQQRTCERVVKAACKVPWRHST